MNNLSFQVIESLLLSGFSVVEVFNPQSHEDSVEYFVVIRFDPKTVNMPMSTIRGLVVTDLVKSGSGGLLTPTSGITSQEKQNVLTKLETLKEVNIEFSSDYSYKWYKSIKGE